MISILRCHSYFPERAWFLSSESNGFFSNTISDSENLSWTFRISFLYDLSNFRESLISMTITIKKCYGIMCPIKRAISIILDIIISCFKIGHRIVRAFMYGKRIRGVIYLPSIFFYHFCWNILNHKGCHVWVFIKLNKVIISKTLIKSNLNSPPNLPLLFSQHRTIFHLIPLSFWKSGGFI